MKRVADATVSGFWVCAACSAILQYVDQRYGQPDIIVTENGVDVPGESDIPYPDLLHDPFRINYMQSYLEQVRSNQTVCFLLCMTLLTCYVKTGISSFCTIIE